jgi:hypothetical protein
LRLKFITFNFTGIANIYWGRKEFLHLYVESLVMETDSSLSIGTGFHYVIGDIWRQKKKDYIRKLRLDNVIIIYVLIFVLTLVLKKNNERRLS